MTKLPESFLKRMKSRLDEAEFNSFEKSYQTEIQTSIRLNPKKQISEFDSFPKVPWLEQGRILPEKKTIHQRSFLARRRILCARNFIDDFG